MTTPAEALQSILARVAPLPPRTLPLAEALGLAAAEAIKSTEQVPLFTNSAMDGYAVRAGDRPKPRRNVPSACGCWGTSRRGPRQTAPWFRAPPGGS